MSIKKYKMTVDPKTIGDMELEWLSDKEREARWNKVRIWLFGIQQKIINKIAR